MIEYVNLRNFRNHEDKKFNLKEKVFIKGDNGVGKTSILEAIYFGSLLKSHRTNDDTALIMNDKPYAKIEIKTNKNLYELVILKDRKHLSIDKVQIRKMSEFIGGYKVIIFSPEDLELIKGTPKVRRKFLDIEMFQINQDYLLTLNTYKNVLNQRNGLLKRLTLTDDLTFLHILTKKLVEEASVIIEKRESFINELNKAFKRRFKSLNNLDEVEVVYKENVPLNELERTFKGNIEKDVLSKITNLGPHRDDFLILFNGALAKDFASQGEQRLITIALKLAIIDLIKEKDIIILLDDILSELDYEKVLKIESLFNLGNQIIITGTNNPFEMEEIKL